MKTTTLCTGAFEENCHLFAGGDGRVWIVDPGAQAEDIIVAAAELGGDVGGILLTHAHFDHIGALPGLQERWPDVPVYVHPADLLMFGHPMNAYPPEYPAILKPRNIVLLDEKAMASLPCVTIHTPGHTPGSVCYLLKDIGCMFSGDTLFCGSIGRTDLPLGDTAQIMKSLDLLCKLPGETRVMPGHGPETTIAQEIKYNPYLQKGGGALYV